MLTREDETMPCKCSTPFTCNVKLGIILVLIFLQININQKSLCLKFNQISPKKSILNPKNSLSSRAMLKKNFIQFEDDLHRE